MAVAHPGTQALDPLATATCARITLMWRLSMKIRLHLPALLLATAFVPMTFAIAPRGVLAAPKEAPCAVCSVRDGEGPEPVKATAKHEGREYYFCSTKCRTEFLQDPAAFLKAEAPRPAPAFTLKDLSGATVSLEQFKGKVVLLDFWATFCGPCVKAMPKLQKLHEQHAAKGFSVVGVATDEEGAKVVSPFVAKTKVKYPILISGTSTWKEYGVETLPALFLIDRSGQIVKRFGGTIEHKIIEREVERVLAQ
jgi:thiol-disulfide isomerase/thioredoxin